jgi:diaminohydroxyphosphoribosylaminopyrimidine deaminase/5-amino-6-(5-phosphoribosylamino)uracil reductase
LIRVVLDERLQTSEASQLVRSARDAPVLLFSGTASGAESASKRSEALAAQGVEVIHDNARGRDIVKVLDELGRRSIQSVLLEGGGAVAGAFMDAGMIDRVTFFVAPVIIGGREAPMAIAGLGVENMAEAFRLEEVEITQLGCDVEFTGYPVKGKDEG